MNINAFRKETRFKKLFGKIISTFWIRPPKKLPKIGAGPATLSSATFNFRAQGLKWHCVHMYVCKRSKTCGEKIALLNSVVPSFTLPHYTHFGRTRKRVLYTVYLYYVSISTKPISAHIYICDRTYRNLLFFPFPVYGKWCGGVLGQLFFFL